MPASISPVRKAETISKFRQHEGDTGSPEVQVALLVRADLAPDRAPEVEPQGPPQPAWPPEDGRPAPRAAGLPEAQEPRALPQADRHARPAPLAMRPPAPVPRRVCARRGSPRGGRARGRACVQGRRHRRGAATGSGSGAAALDAAPHTPVLDRIEARSARRQAARDHAVPARPRRHDLRGHGDRGRRAALPRRRGGVHVLEPEPDANERGRTIACSIPHRSWGGGTRADGAAYFRGELVFSCEGPPAIAGKVTLDCGDIRAGERASLDEQRRRAREGSSRLRSGAAGVRLRLCRGAAQVSARAQARARPADAARSEIGLGSDQSWRRAPSRSGSEVPGFSFRKDCAITPAGPGKSLSTSSLFIDT